jgi:hypothetical protein
LHFVLVVRDLSVIRRNLIPFPIKVLVSALIFPGVGRYQLVPGIASCDIFMEPRWIVVVKIDNQSIRKTGILVDSPSNFVRKTKQDGVRILGGQVLTVRSDVS